MRGYTEAKEKFPTGLHQGKVGIASRFIVKGWANGRQFHATQVKTARSVGIWFIKYLSSQYVFENVVVLMRN